MLIPIDIYLSGVKTVLKYAAYGFAAGWLAMGLIVFPVFTLHYRKTRSGSETVDLTDNFNKKNFLLVLILSIFLALATTLGHAILVIYRLR